jgi:hypothetical protein
MFIMVDLDWLFKIILNVISIFRKVFFNNKSQKSIIDKETYFG